MKLLPGVKTLVLVLFVPSLLFAQDYPCANSTARVGESVADLLAQCGQPTWKQRLRTDEVIVTIDDSKGTAGKGTTNRGNAGNDTNGKDQRKSIINVEEWSYNLGPSNLNRIFTIENEKVSSMRFAGYGFEKDQADGTPCIDQFVPALNTVPEVLAKCGKPSATRTDAVVTQKQIDATSMRKITSFIEEWTFNSGPDRPSRIVSFRDGVVSSVRDR